MILDPVLDSYYLMDAVTTELPLEIEQTAQARDLGVRMMADKQFAAAEKVQLTILSSSVAAPNSAIHRGIQVAFDSNSELKSKLETNTQVSFTSTNKFIEIIHQQIIGTQNLTIQPSDYFATGTKAINAQLQLYDVTSPALDNLLQARLNSSYHKKYLVEAFTLLVLATVIFVLLAFARNLTKRQQVEEEIHLLETMAYTTSEEDFHSVIPAA